MATTFLVCVICGEKAKCSYFGAVSCESCKVFFRRAVQDKVHCDYTCAYDGDCRINARTRKLCRKCRFDKCIFQGMRPQWVKPGLKMLKKGVNMSVLRQHGGASVDSSVYEQWQIPKEPCPAEGNCCVRHNLDLNDLECIRQAMDSTARTIKEIPFPDKAYVERPTFPHIVNVLQIVVRRITAYAKTFKEFRELEIADQLSLLKGATLEVMMTRKATTILYKKTKKGFVWMVEDERYLLSQDDLKHAYDRNLYESHMNYILSLMNLKVDDTTLVLLSCVILFSPDHEELGDVKKIETVQWKYVTLLEKYLHCTFGCRRGRKLFPKLLVLMGSAHEASHNYSKSVLEISRDHIEPIMKEFFDVE